MWLGSGSRESCDLKMARPVAHGSCLGLARLPSPVLILILTLNLSHTLDYIHTYFHAPLPAEPPPGTVLNARDIPKPS